LNQTRGSAMNAERLHVICLEIEDAIKSTDLLIKMNGLTKNVNSLANNPYDKNLQQKISNEFNNLCKVLNNFPTDDFIPAWRQVLEEIGGSEVLGVRLKNRMERVFEINQITPAAIHGELKDISSDLQKFNNAVRGIIYGFDHFGIGREQLEPGECEIGILLPRRAVHEDINELGEEFEDLDLVFKPFFEVAGGKEPFKVKSLSSSDFTIYLSIDPITTALLAYAVREIMSTFNEALAIKKSWAELKKFELEVELLERIAGHATVRVRDKIKELADEIIEKHYHKDDDGRKNELRNSIEISLNKLANKIDKGFSFEPRAEPLEEGKDEEESNDQQKIRESIETIISISKTLQLVENNGEPILCLPETKEEIEENSESEKEEETGNST